MYIFKSKVILILAIFSSLLFVQTIAAQQGVPENWFNLDPTTDGVNGVSSEKMYETILKDKSSTEVIVAVIDGGVDPNHEDLKDVMWNNPGEIPGNKIDDDGNGYVDDVFGWNFIGGPDGKNVGYDTYELTRVYKTLAKKYANANRDKLSSKDQAEYDRYLQYKKDVDSQQTSAAANVKEYSQVLDFLKSAFNGAGEALGDEPLTQAAVDSLDGSKFGMVKSFLGNLLPQIQGFEGTVGELEEMVLSDYEGALADARKKAEYAYNVDFDSRKIVKDDYGNWKESSYGNPDVKGPDGFHGTFVAGVIAADRKNDIGIKGVADHVKIMAVRAVPDGDERDKDVANAIRYAVDNGAKVINMSFGKGFSPREKAVEKAIRYADRKDVLMVHAAGNSSQDNDVAPNYPNDTYDVARCLFCGKKARSWIAVGALAYEPGENMVATFSNYGQNDVDVFAPGHQIRSTDVGSTYTTASGTSFAAPVVAGIAAVIRSRYPDLKAREVKEIITQSSLVLNQKVHKPGSGELTDFTSLSTSGGVANAAAAIQLASQYQAKKGKKSGVKPRA